MPVHLATTSATSSASTTSLRNFGAVLVGRGVVLGRLGRRELLLELGDRPVLELGGAAQVGLALGALELGLGLLDPLLELGNGADGLLLALPLGVHRVGALALLGQRPLELLAPRERARVVVVAERLELDLELHDVPVDLVDLGRLGVDLHPDPRGGLVDQVDRLVGQEAVGDVALAERRRRDQRGVLDADLVVDLVALLEAAEDRDRVLDGRLAHVHGLEAALERGVLLDVLAVLVERGRADRAQLAAGEHRLEHVAGVHRALGGAGADDRVELVDEHDDLALGVGDLLEHGLEPVLELAAVLGAGDHRAQVERDQPAVLEALGDVAGDDPLGEALDDRGLADARLADQHRVVLGAPAEDLDHAADLVVAADHRVELALRGGLGQVAAETLERAVLVLGVLVGDAVAAADLGQRLEQMVVAGAVRSQRVTGPAGMLRDREQQVLGRDVLVIQLAHLGLGGRGGSGRARSSRPAGSAVAAPWIFGSASRACVVRLANGRRVDAELAQHGHDDASVLLEQDREQVLGHRLGIAALIGEPLRGLERLLGLDRETVWLHRRSRYQV